MLFVGDYDYDMDIAVQRQEAEEIGFEKGYEAGVKQENVNIAKNLKEMELSIEIIAKVTDLTTLEIEAI
jgi:hypothetical protein